MRSFLPGSWGESGKLAYMDVLYAVRWMVTTMMLTIGVWVKDQGIIFPNGEKIMANAQGRAEHIVGHDHPRAVLQCETLRQRSRIDHNAFDVYCFLVLHISLRMPKSERY